MTAGNLSPELRVFLAEIRQHPLFPQLLAAVETPRIPVFRRSQSAEPEQARAAWIFASGQLAGHDAWIHMLTGTIPSQKTE